MNGFRAWGEVNKQEIQKLVRWPMKNRAKQVGSSKSGLVTYKKWNKTGEKQKTQLCNL